MALGGLKLFVDPVSQPARALILLVRTASIPHQENYVNLMKGEHMKKDYVKVNPFKKIPAIQDGDLTILESCAALRYIADKYDSSGQWYPKDLAVRAKVDEYLDWQHTNTRAHSVGFFRNKVVYPMLKRCDPDMTAVNEHTKGLKLVEKNLASYFLKSSPFIAGDKPTIADLLAACEMEQPFAGGYALSQATVDFIERVKGEVGPEQYDEVHQVIRKMSKRA